MRTLFGGFFLPFQAKTVLLTRTVVLLAYFYVQQQLYDIRLQNNDQFLGRH